MATSNGHHAPSSNNFTEPRFTSERQLILLNSDELRSKNREQLIEKLERVIQEKNASISKLEQRELHLEENLKKRNAEFRALEEQLRQFDEKTRTFEELHHVQVQTFEKTIRDCQIENERLCEQVDDLEKQIREKSDFEAIHQEKILSFDRIASETQLWRQKLDSYKSTIEQRDETIVNFKREISELQRRKQTNGDIEENAMRVQIATLENTVQDRDNEIEHLKLTLRRVRDTLGPGQLNPINRWKSTEDLGRQRSPKKRRSSPPVRDQSPSAALDIEYLKKKIRTLTDRLTNVQQLLVKRDDQIVTLKKVHDKRWLRLKHLQKQYRSVKDELQSYTDDESNGKYSKNDLSYRKVIRRPKSGCSVCADQRRRNPRKSTRKFLRHEDDDNVWNEVTKLRRENARLINENVSLNEKIDLQEVEINEQSIVIDELRNEIHLLNDKDEQRQSKITSPTKPKSTDDQQRVIEELDKKLYELESERTCLIFEHERLKTNLDLCIDEKQHLLQQRTQNTNEMKKLKLRILSLQDQVHKFKRTNPMTTKKSLTTPVSTMKKRGMKKKMKKSCLEMLLDQNSTLIDDLQDESSILYRVSSDKVDRWRRSTPRHRACSLCDDHTQSSLMKRKRRPSMATKRINQNLKKNFTGKARLGNSFLHDPYSHYARRPATSQKAPTRVAVMRRRIEQLEMDLADSKDENEQLNQRLSTTLSRINILKTTNQRLATECDKFKRTNPLLPPPPLQPVPERRRHDSASSDASESVDNLHARLKNTSFDAARQRRLNKTLQTDNETLTKNLQSLTDKLTHSERDVASKRTLIENYKTKLTELETNGPRVNDRSTSENDEERLKSLTDTMEKLRISLDSHKNRLQAVTREKQILETRYGQLVEEHQKLKIRFEDIQTKHRLGDTQLRQYRTNQDQLSQELQTSRRLSEQQLLTLNTKTQDALNRITVELDRTQRRLNEYERFTQGFLHEMVRRSTQLSEHLRRAREHQKQRESLSTTMPGYDSAMNTASKILNLTQDDLDDIMSTTDESFNGHGKQETADKGDKVRQKVSKLLASQEEFASKLLKIFSKKLDEIQAADRDLAMVRNT